MTELLYSEVEEDLRASVRSLLADRAAPAAVLARTESAEPVDTKLWRSLAADLGCAGLPVPEERGGAGASWRETAVVLEELGRAVAPVPFFGSAVLATAALIDSGDELLADLASGSRTAALAVPFSTAPGGAVAGRTTSVADGLTADVFLVPADDGLYALDAADVTRTLVVSLDQTRPLVDLSDVDTAKGRRVAGPEAVDKALTAGAALLSAEQLGIAEWCLETTVAYAKTRRQFARQIGSYQAVKHRLADVWVEVTQARAVSRYAVACLADDDPDLPVAAALAQAFCSQVAVHAAEECVQLHGGIGFTWEHPAHLYLKRAKANAIALGTADRHRAAIGKLVNLQT
jgi:alkylation response protein AidB-like acyl-CoA dehydrogenase